MCTTKRPLWKTAWWRASLLVAVFWMAAWGDPQATVLAQTSAPRAIEWRGEYYANRDLAGQPALVRTDRGPAPSGASAAGTALTIGLNLDWADGAPARGLPADDFSVRWTAEVSFAAGTYRFLAFVDDGIRLYVDDALVIDDWQEGARRERTALRELSAGQHSLRVEYYERGGVALVGVGWEKVVLPSDWEGEYWRNRELKGDPALKRSEPSATPGGGLDLYWGWNAPASGMPKDEFSARWTRQVTFGEGVYRFRVAADDGARLYLDGELVLDQWREGPRQEWTVDRWLSAGVHTLRLEYFEVGGEALVSLRWENLSAYSDWKGEYWTNRNLEGAPALVRNDPAIVFNWEMGSPGAGIPADGFSARWTRRLFWDAGLYRFTVWVDDGVRIWVDDRRIIDDWGDRELHKVTGDIRLGRGTHTVTVEYYDSVFDAQISVGWAKIAEEEYSDWKGEYWANRWLSGAPDLVRNDDELDFDWGKRAPAGNLPIDGFSARWTREMRFAPDVYRFYVHADDGVKVYIDGKKVLDEWHDTVGKIYTFNRQMDGEHDLEIRFYENVGDARMHFWWMRISDLPIPQ